MKIRHFQPGDEAIQAEIYNEAAAGFPSFKPATRHEIAKRASGSDFDPTLRFFLEYNGEVVAYIAATSSGRISYPWCRTGSEKFAKQFFEHVLQDLRGRGFKKVYAAYRPDWKEVDQFLKGRGFVVAREMVNFFQDIIDMPTIPARPSTSVTPLSKDDIPAVYDLCPEALNIANVEELEKHLLHNPYFGKESIFLVRAKAGEEPIAVGILITEATYSDPNLLDPCNPCFWLGAFGTENCNTKRIKGLFSFLARNDNKLPLLALDMLGQASMRVQEHDDIDTLAAQVRSDIPHLLHFYEQHFQRVGSFPIFEKVL